MKAENGDPGFAYTYQWYRVDAGTETAIPGATSKTYTLVQADAGKTFRVAVSFIDDAGKSEGPLKSNEYPAGAENGELRLEGGANALEGRLEVFPRRGMGHGVRRPIRRESRRRQGPSTTDGGCPTSRRGKPASSWATRPARWCRAPA